MSSEAVEYVYQNVGVDLDPSPDAVGYVYQNIIDRSVVVGAQVIEVLISAEPVVTPPEETTSTRCDYEPVPGFYKTPVQVGSVANLTIAESPLGQAIVGWIDTTGTDTFYVAVLSEFSDIYQDDVVEEADRRIVRTNIGSIQSASVWVEGGDLFAAIQYVVPGTPSVGYVQCFIANDPENPTSWSLRSTIDTQADVQITDIFSCGPVTVVGDTGRWLMPIGTFASHATAAADVSSIVTSLDRGITWSVLVAFRNSPLNFGGTTGPITNTIAQDPVTGYIYWNHHAGPVGNAFTYRSTDLGASFTQINNSTSTWEFYAANCTDKYWAALPGGTGWRAWEVVDPTLPGTTGFIDTGIDIINSYQGEQFQAIFFPNGWYAIIDKNRVAAAAPGGPRFWVGYVGWAS